MTSRSITTSRPASWCSSTPPKAESFRPGPRTPTGTSRYSRSPIARSLAGATTSTRWRSSTRSDGRHVDGRRSVLLRGLFAQNAPQNLARSRLRDRVDEREFPDLLVVRDLLRDEALDVGGSEVVSLLEYDVRRGD